MNGEDHFAAFDEEITSQPIAASASNTNPPPSPYGGNRGSQQYSGRGFSDEIYSEKISAKMRTFYIDVKQSANGKFLKISEKSRGGQKSTIMMDGEDLPAFIEALKNAQNAIS